MRQNEFLTLRSIRQYYHDMLLSNKLSSLEYSNYLKRIKFENLKVKDNYDLCNL